MDRNDSEFGNLPQFISRAIRATSKSSSWWWTEESVKIDHAHTPDRVLKMTMEAITIFMAGPDRDKSGLKEGF